MDRPLCSVAARYDDRRMTRAYLRLDPAFDERKEAYPDGPYAALVGTFCLAESQPERGRFRSLDYLKRLLGKRGKHAPFLLAHGDLHQLPDNRIYVDGWDEWQEGDWKVGERVARIRNRPKRPGGNGGSNAAVTVPVTPDVTVGVTPPRQSAGVALATAEQSGALAVDDASTGRVIRFKGTNDREEKARLRLQRIEELEAKLQDPDLSPSLREVALAELARLRSAA